MKSPRLFLAYLSSSLLLCSSVTSDASVQENGLASSDCQIQCPLDHDPFKLILPTITQSFNASGAAENILECWQINTLSTKLPGIDNAFRLNWEDGFDAAYQYVFTGDSFMPPHPAPAPSLIVMSSGIGQFFCFAPTNLNCTSADLR
jgi:hypothetical protein